MAVCSRSLNIWGQILLSIGFSFTLTPNIGPIVDGNSLFKLKPLLPDH